MSNRRLIVRALVSSAIGLPAGWWFYTETSLSAVAALFLILWANNISQATHEDEAKQGDAR